MTTGWATQTPGIPRQDLRYIDSKFAGVPGPGDRTAALAAAIDTAILTALPLHVRNAGQPIRIDGQIARTLALGQRLAVICEPGVEFDIRNSSTPWLQITAA